MNNEITDKSIYDVLKERDLIKQITYEDEFKEMVKNEKNSCSWYW